MNSSDSTSSSPQPSGLQVELGAGRVSKRGWALFFVLALGCAVLIWTATLVARSPSASPSPAATSPVPAAPAITWSTDVIDVILSPGERASRSVTFTSSEELRNVVVEAVPAIAGFITISPSTISRVRANRAQTVQLAFSIPASATLGDYIGTIHLRLGSQTLPQTMKVVLNNWQLFVSSGLGFQVHFPPQLRRYSLPEAPNLIILQSTDTELVLGGAAPEDDRPYSTQGFRLVFSVQPLTTAFAISTWLDTEFSNPDVVSIEPQAVDNQSGYRVVLGNQIGAGEPFIVLPRPSSVLLIRYESSFAAGSAEEQAALNYFEAVIRSLTLL